MNIIVLCISLHNSVQFKQAYYTDFSHYYQFSTEITPLYFQMIENRRKHTCVCHLVVFEVSCYSTNISVNGGKISQGNMPDGSDKKLVKILSEDI